MCAQICPFYSSALLTGKAWNTLWDWIHLFSCDWAVQGIFYEIWVQWQISHLIEKLSSNYKTSVSYSWSWFPAYPRCRVNGSTSHQFPFIYHLWLWLIHVYLLGDSASEVMQVLCKSLIAEGHGNRWRNTAYLKRWIIVISSVLMCSVWYDCFIQHGQSFKHQVILQQPMECRLVLFHIMSFSPK